MLATRTESVGAFQIHGYVAFTLSGHEAVGQLKTAPERLQYELERQGVPKKSAQTFAKAFLDRVPLRKFSGDHFLKGGIPEAAKRDVLDADFTHQAVRRALLLTPGGYEIGEAMKFDVIDSDLGLHVFHDIDLERINRHRSLMQPPIDPLTTAHLLSQIQDARADLALASFYGGDFVTSNVTSSIIQVRHEELLRRSALNADSRHQFTEVVLPDTPTLSEVIDAGERSFDEFLSLLDRAARFKHWLSSVNPDEGLVRTYLRDVTSEGWIQRLPAKSVRYMLTLALDAANPVAGLVSGFVDNFVIEKLLSGWRPNHFVDSKLGPFLYSR
ncbi:hypothetical protein PLCT1_01795 [Planctomycetaceae bacterium]|nr:hypothetical protein PLCT1_01795 [Planctomycetaceae bacterium]